MENVKNAERKIPAETELARASNNPENLEAVVEAGYEAMLKTATSLGMTWEDTDGGIVFDTPDGGAKVINVTMKDE